MSKLERRAELQNKYHWQKTTRPLPRATVRDVVSKISDYDRQEITLEWILNNMDVFMKVIPAAWLPFLCSIEKTPDSPIEELLDTYKREGVILSEIQWLTATLKEMHRDAKDLLHLNPSGEPLFGLGKHVKFYAEKETELEDYEARLAKLREN